jgi:hypothetical protein
MKCNGKNKKNKVFKGVGMPMNLSVCLSSMLNFAKRKIEKNGIINAQRGRYFIEASKSFGIS